KRESDVIVERIVGRLSAGLERHAEKLGPGPAQPADGLVPPGPGQLLKAAVDGRIVFDQSVPLDDRVDVVALAPGCERNELDRAPGQWTRDVTAKLDHRAAVMLEQIVVVRRADRGGHTIVLEQVKPARLP